MKQLNEQSVADRIASLEAEIAEKKIKFPPEIFEYVKDHFLALQRISREGRMPTEKDMEFMEHARAWLSLDEVDRKGWLHPQQIISEYNLAAERGLSLKQWADLCNLIKVAYSNVVHEKNTIPEAVDSVVSEFKGDGTIEIEDGFISTANPGIISLPDGLKIFGDVKINACKNLAKLPKDFFVMGSLDASNCPLISSIPESLVVGKSIILTGTSIKIVPDSLKAVKGILFLKNCTKLKKLPDNLKVEVDLSLYGCSELKELPKNLFVGEVLDIIDCTALERLPDDLKVDGYLYASKNLKPQVLADAERLKLKGQIADIKYIDDPNK
jgi:hypothetical protein